MRSPYKAYTNLIREFMITEFKLKYQSSFIGYFWSLLNPLLMFSVLYLVFSMFTRFEMEYYHLFLLLGVILWGYFAEATTNAMLAIQAKAGIIKKIYFPREIIVLASNGSTFLTLLLNLFVFMVLMVVSKITVTVKLLYLPFFFLELVVLIYGISLILSTLYVRYIDTLHLWRVLLQIGFWITPIIYPMSVVPEEMKKIILLNPLAGIITQIREVLIYNTHPLTSTMMITFFSTGVIFLIGKYIFKNKSSKFAEWI